MNVKYIVTAALVVLAVFGVVIYAGGDKAEAPQGFSVVEDVPAEQVAAEEEPVLQEVVEAASVTETVEEVAADDFSEPDAAFVPASEVGEGAVLADDASLEKRFEFTLNTMLQDVAVKSREYQKQRKIMKELSKPENFVSAEYVEENFVLFQDAVPNLYEKSSEIFDVFVKADEEITALVLENPEDQRALILEQWASLKSKDAAAYQRFFELEGDVIQAYERLMRFYYMKRAHYTVDAETGEIAFVNENDKNLVRKLQLQVNRMERAQAQALAMKAAP